MIGFFPRRPDWDWGEKLHVLCNNQAKYLEGKGNKERRKVRKEKTNLEKRQDHKCWKLISSDIIMWWYF